jgi:hypothetical protein
MSMTRLLALCSLLLPIVALGQSTTVNSTITDSTGQVWSNGSYTITFVPTPNLPNNYQWNGSTFVPQKYQGVFDNTGTFTVTLPDNNTITPAGTQWAFVLCPNATATCTTVTTPVTGSNENLSSLFSSRVVPPVIFAAPLPRAYSQSEVATPPPTQGGQFYQVIGDIPYYWTGTAWKALGGADGVLLDPTSPQEICCFGLTVDKSFTAGSINGVINANSYSSLNAAVAACSGACTVDVNAAIPLSANLALTSATTLRFNQPGSITMSGFTLTTGKIQAPAYQIFNSCTGLTYGTMVNAAPVEWCGATADGSGGTDDTAAIQQTINSLQIGQGLLSAGSYRIATGPVNITKPSVGISGVGMREYSPTQYGTPPASVLVNTTANTDTLDVFGTSISANVAFTTLRDFNVERSVAPSGSAKGISLSYTYGATIRNVGSVDSVYNLYVHSSGSQGTGVVEDFMGQWGSNGISETAGNYYGIYLDSSDGLQNPSFRIRHSFVVDANANPAVISYGLAAVGTQLNDLMVYGFETATVDYGVMLNQTGFNSAITSADIHFTGGINDGCITSCYLIQNLTAAGGAGLEISGGYLTNQSSNPLIDVESSSGVHINGVQFGVAGGGAESACIDFNNSTNSSATGNLCQGVSNVGILLNLSTAIAITGNNLTGNADGNGLITLVGSGLNSITGNTLGGTGASLIVDVNSNSNTGLYTNPIQASLSPASILGSNPLSVGQPTSATQYQLSNQSSWRQSSGTPTGTCINGSMDSNLLTTTGTFATYQCKGNTWVGIGTAY